MSFFVQVLTGPWKIFRIQVDAAKNTSMPRRECNSEAIIDKLCLMSRDVVDKSRD